MKVTIIIAVYRAEKYVENCLRSVAAQTFEGDIECLIIDDRGGDRSIEIAEQFIKSYKGRFQFRIITHEKNLGASASRNTGINNASGEYFYFLDNDDYIDVDCIKKLTEPLKRGKYDFVQGNFEVKGGTTGVQPLQLKTGEYLDRDFIIYGYTHGLWPLTLWNKLMNTEFVRRNKLYFEEIIAEDNLWSLDLACCVDRMYVVSDITYMYFIQDDSIMRKLEQDWQRAFKDRLCLLHGLIKRQHKSKHIRNYVIYYGNGLLRDAFTHKKLTFELYNEIKRTVKPTPFKSFSKGQMRFIDLVFDIHYSIPPRMGYLLKKINLLLFKR